MKKKQKQILHGLVVLMGMTFMSCSQGTELTPDDSRAQGRLTLILESNTDFLGTTRAVNENQYKNIDNYDVVVLDKNNIEKLNCKASEITNKMPITLPIGSYTVKAFYGTEKPYSRNEFYVYDEEQGTIQAEGNHTVSLTCEPTCGKVSVAFEEGMSTYFSEYKVLFKGTEAMGTDVVKWEKNDTDPWYIKLNEGGETVQFEIHVTTKDGFVNPNQEKDAVKVGSFKLNRNKAYKMNVNCTHTPTGEGAVDLDITIDETTNDKKVEIEVPTDWL